MSRCRAIFFDTCRDAPVHSKAPRQTLSSRQSSRQSSRLSSLDGDDGDDGDAPPGSLLLAKLPSSSAG